MIAVTVRTVFCFGGKPGHWDCVTGHVPFLCWVVVRRKVMEFTKLYTGFR